MPHCTCLTPLREPPPPPIRPNPPRAEITSLCKNPLGENKGFFKVHKRDLILGTEGACWHKKCLFGCNTLCLCKIFAWYAETTSSSVIITLPYPSSVERLVLMWCGCLYPRTCWWKMFQGGLWSVVLVFSGLLWSSWRVFLVVFICQVFSAWGFECFSLVLLMCFWYLCLFFFSNVCCFTFFLVFWGASASGVRRVIASIGGKGSREREREQEIETEESERRIYWLIE